MPGNDGAKRVFRPPHFHLKHMVQVKRVGFICQHNFKANPLAITLLTMRRWSEDLSCMQVTVLVYTCLPGKLLIAPSLILKKSSNLDYKLLPIQRFWSSTVPGTGLNTLLSLCYLIFTIIISIFTDEDLRLGKFKEFSQNPASLNRNNRN